MTRVLFVCTVPTDKSGIPNVIFNLLSNFDTCEYEIGYVSINEPAELYKEKLIKKNAALYVIPRKLTNPIGYISKLSKIARNYDIIHVHGNSATMALEMIAAKLAGIKLRIAHSHNTTCTFKIIDKLLRPIFYLLCNGRIACGKEAGKWLFDNQDFRILRNGIDLNRYKFSSPQRKKIQLSLDVNNNVVIGHIGNFNNQKNHSFLIDVFHKYHRINSKSKLILLGDGPHKKHIEKKVRYLGLTDDILFAGSVDNPEDYLNSMDLIVMPSLFEGLPLTLIEEQANGLNILAADTITPDANITGLITYKSLVDGAESWALKINELVMNSINTHRDSPNWGMMIKDAGYDLETINCDLIKYYSNHLKN